MPIKGGIGTGVITVPATTDTVIFQPQAGERIVITACSVSSTATVNLTIYESPDLTTASGTAIETIALTTGARQNIASVISQGYEATNIVVNADAAGCTTRGTYTVYTGDAV